MESSISGELGHALPSSTSWSKFKSLFSRQPKRKRLPCKVIAFHHAGYDPRTQETVIFRLRGCAAYSGGVRASTAMLFFGMLVDAGTLDRVHISTSRGGRSIHYKESDHWNRSHYFIHSRNPHDGGDILYQFPLTASLQEWTVPKRPPQAWSQRGHGRTEDTRSEVCIAEERPKLDWDTRCSEAVAKRDKICVITEKRPTHCKRAYFIPYDEHEFWAKHQMSSLLVPPGLPGVPPKMHISHPMNGILMHTELAQAFEEGEMVILPIDDHWIVHFFNPSSYLAIEKDKDKIRRDQKFVRMSKEIPREYLLASVARAAFKLAEAFLEQNKQLQPTAVSTPSPPETHAPSELSAPISLPSENQTYRPDDRIDYLSPMQTYQFI